MAQLPDFEAGLSALEARVRELVARVQHNEQNAAAARVLVGGADRDVDPDPWRDSRLRQATTSPSTRCATS